MSNSVSLTIVTVCREAAIRIDATAGSVAALACAEVEWLVIDGASIDDTVARVQAWRTRLAGPIRIVSEPDAGIYDAMNKGLRLAAGEWVWFLNAGDEACGAAFFDAWLVRRSAGVDLVTAKVRQVDPRDGFTQLIGGPFSWEAVAKGRVPPHQACVYRREAALAAGGYPAGFGLVADTVLTLRVAGSGGVTFVEQTAAIYPTDGVSSRFDWRWRVHRDKARAIRAGAPTWVWRRYRWRWPFAALRATASHLLACVGLLGVWRALKRRR